MPFLARQQAYLLAPFIALAEYLPPVRDPTDVHPGAQIMSATSALDTNNADAAAHTLS